MIEEIYNYFTIEILYYWVNFGVLPFWLILIFFSNSHLCKYLVTSILPFFILTGAYIFILYKSYLNSFDFLGNFNLYLGIDSLSELFKDNSFLMMFWIHFISINLFTGGWIVKDSQKFNMNKVILTFPLIITYLIGPLGLVFYWLIRIFYAKNINLYD
tara:strand:- start:1001 stop:1474 length:474 start_codon:yes stop_codon:yes gene_type:complete